MTASSQSPHPEQAHDGPLAAAERLMMNIIISRAPHAEELGAALYPIRHEMVSRGFSEAQIDQIIHRLTELGIVESGEVRRRNYINDDDAYPVYRVTPIGFDVASAYSPIKLLYCYTVRVLGDRSRHQGFLRAIHAISGIRNDSRFIDEPAVGVSRIAIWSYEDVEGQVRELAAAANATILSIEQRP